MYIFESQTREHTLNFRSRDGCNAISERMCRKKYAPGGRIVPVRRARARETAEKRTERGGQAHILGHGGVSSMRLAGVGALGIHSTHM